MGELQNLTNEKSETDLVSENPELEALQLRQQSWIDFCAIGGLLTDDDGTLKPMKIGEFADMLKVSRQTLYEWKKSIPFFQERVKQRQMELGASPARIAKVYNGLYLKASAGNADAAKLWLQAFAGWKPPKQEIDIEHNFGLADLVSRKKMIIDQEKKVIDVTPNETAKTDNS